MKHVITLHNALLDIRNGDLDTVLKTDYRTHLTYATVQLSDGTLTGRAVVKELEYLVKYVNPEKNGRIAYDGACAILDTILDTLHTQYRQYRTDRFCDGTVQTPGRLLLNAQLAINAMDTQSSELTELSNWIDTMVSIPTPKTPI